MADRQHRGGQVLPTAAERTDYLRGAKERAAAGDDVAMLAVLGVQLVEHLETITKDSNRGALSPFAAGGARAFR